MRIAFGEPLDREDTGKHKFLKRLSIQFQRMGIQVVHNKTSDIFLHIGRNLDWAVSPRRVVMRVDGLILNKEKPYEKMNRRMAKYMDKSHGLVYQSSFCRDAHVKYLKIRKQSVIIFNGADPNEFLPRNPKNFFISTCCWRPHKRLEETCHSFKRALKRGLDADLLIAGKTDHKVKHERIKYIGWVNPKQLNKYLSEAIASIHLAWLDWCPNSMVEAVVAGCPLIYSSSGGSTEVGYGCGMPISDHQWKYKPCDLYKPPKLDRDEIVSAMISLKEYGYSVSSNKFHIDHIACQYVDFFEKLLSQ